MSDLLCIYKATGTIDAGNRTEGITANGTPWIEVDATLFYEGRHRPEDPHWSPKDLDLIDERFIRPTGKLGEEDWTVPIQLDHSESARDTKGILLDTWRALVEVGGRQLEGLKGRLRYIGRDAVDNVKANLWKKLSLSVYANSKRIREVTVTPFPCLTGATNHTESESEDTPMAKAKESLAPAPAPEVVTDETKPDDTPKTFAGPTTSLDDLRAEFSEKTRRQQEQIDALLKQNEEQGRLLRFAELTKEVDRYSEQGKTLPPMREAELALLETLNPAQTELFRAYKEATPNLVEFSTLGSQDGEEVDKHRVASAPEDKATVDRLASYSRFYKPEGGVQ